VEPASTTTNSPDPAAVSAAGTDRGNIAAALYAGITTAILGSAAVRTLVASAVMVEDVAITGTSRFPRNENGNSGPEAGQTDDKVSTFGISW